MKAEERHELRENDLANWLQYGLWAFVKQNGSYILLALALAFLGYHLWALYQAKQEAARQAAWINLQHVESSENPLKDLADLVDTSDLKPVKAQACLQLGQMYGSYAGKPEALDFLRISRTETLSKSYDYYTKALEFQGDDALIAAKAHLGIAAVYEDRGEWDKAKTEYQILVNDKMFAGTPFAALGQDRLASLDDRKNAPRLAAMIPQTPKPGPALPTTPLPGMGGLGGTGTGGLTLPPLGSQLTPATSPFGDLLGTPPNKPSTPLLPLGPTPLGPSPLGPPSLGISPPTPTPEPTTAPK